MIDLQHRPGLQKLTSQSNEECSNQPLALLEHIEDLVHSLSEMLSCEPTPTLTVPVRAYTPQSYPIDRHRKCLSLHELDSQNHHIDNKFT